MAVKTAPENFPNLKIEVENDLLEEAMDVDEDGNEEKKGQPSNIEDSELEEGEISDSKDDDLPAPRTADARHARHERQDFLPEFERRYENKSGAFVTGIDIFSKDGQEKLDVRAKRFGLDPSQVKPLSEEKLLQLYESLGVTMEEGSMEKNGFRLDALHIRGTENMSTQDVFDYFKDYGPASIEWINDVCCNVVWLDKASPARALFGLSRPISGLTPQGGRRDFEEVVLVEEDDDADEEDMPEADAAPGLAQQPVKATEQATEEAILVEPAVPSTDTTVQKAPEEKSKDSEAVPALEIEVPIPPGLWRLGAPYAKSRCILLRFCTRVDRKPKQAEKMSDYYKKYGNPNYGGIRGIISTSRKRRYHSDRHHQAEPPDMSDDPSGKNPWGSLAQNWGTMDRSHTKPGFFDPDDPLLLDRPAELRTILRSGRSNPPPPPPTLHSSASDSEQSSEDSEEDSRWRKRLKGPHMRMYADDEEIKVQKRRKLNARLGKRPSPPPRARDDLRSKLSRVTRPKITRGSVWTRLEAAKTKREVELAEPSGEEWSTEDDEDNEDGEEVVKTTVRSQINDLREAIGSRKAADEGDDLRSKLNKRKKKRDLKSSPPTIPVYEKSPLRIEISNDEYCGDSTGSGSGSGSETGSESGSESGSKSGSGSESGSGSSTSGEESS